MQAKEDGFFPNLKPRFATGSLGPRETQTQLHCVLKVLLVNRPGLELLDPQLPAWPGQRHLDLKRSP